MSITDEEIIFHNGTVFDGQAFLPPGTCVRVRGGTITAVGPAGEVAPSAGGGGRLALAGVSLVDLGGGTLLPGFIDAHVHPVYAGGQLRRCDLRDGATAADRPQRRWRLSGWRCWRSDRRSRRRP